MPKRTMAGAAPAEEKPAEEKPEDSEPDDPDKISVTRKGEPIGPYSREKAKEYFASGQLLPTDWGWHDGMDDWKPINEVLGMAAPAQTTAAAGKPGKGKKVAMIAGIVVLVSGLIFAGITYGPDLVAKVSGGGKIETPEELANLTLEALKGNDKDAFFKLFISESNVKGLIDDQLSEVDKMSDEYREDIKKMPKEEQKSLEEFKKELREALEEEFDFSDEEREQKRQEIFSNFDEMRVVAEDDGVDWSDVTVSDVGPFERNGKVSDERINQSLKNAWEEQIVKNGNIKISITSKGKEYDLILVCLYSPSVGFVLLGVH